MSDGYVGRVLDDGIHYITSPNCDGPIPEPILNTDHYVWMRSDGFYGPDDPTQWPQLYNHLLPHLTTIPRRPLDESHPYWLQRVMWMPLTPEDIEVDPQPGVLEIGSVCTRRLIELSAAIAFSKARPPTAPVLMTSKAEEQFGGYIAHWNIIQDLCLSRLSNAVVTIQELRRDYAELQRNWLIMQGFYDYMTHFQPLMNGRVGDPGRPPLAHVMGAFLDDEVEAAWLLRGGIRFWLVRKVRDFRRQIILEVGDRAEFEGVEDEACPPFPVTYHGRSSDSAKMDAMARAARSSFRHTTVPDVPGSMSTLTTEVVTYPPSSGPTRTPVRQAKRERSDPRQYLKAQTVRIIKETMVPLSERPGGIYAPIPLWPYAMRNIDIESPESFRRQIPQSDKCYHFPSPIMLLGSEKEWRVRSYLRAVHYLKLAFIVRLRDDPVPMPTHKWRDICDLGISPPPELEERNKLISERLISAKPRHYDVYTATETVRKWLSGQTKSGVEAKVRPPVTENGYLMIPLPVEEGRQIVWEFCELNFRWELLALDARIALCDVSSRNVHHYDSPEHAWGLRRQQLILQCFPASSLMHVHPSQARKGLASPSWKDRLSYVYGLQQVMDRWPSPKPHGWEKVQDCKNRGSDPLVVLSVHELDAWQVTLTNYYAQTFYDHFGRGPVLPHTL